VAPRDAVDRFGGSGAAQDLVAVVLPLKMAGSPPCGLWTDHPEPFGFRPSTGPTKWSGEPKMVGTLHGLRINQIVFTTSRLPVTTSGKIRRRACRDAWRNGAFDAAAGAGAAPAAAQSGNRPHKSDS